MCEGAEAGAGAEEARRGKQVGRQASKQWVRGSKDEATDGVVAVPVAMPAAVADGQCIVA